MNFKINTYCDDNIFKSITDIGDEEIIFYNSDDDDDDEIPLTISIGQILENYFYHNHHISIITLLKIIDKNINNRNDSIIIRLRLLTI